MDLPIKQQIYNLLKWSEKYTGTDMVYLARGGFWAILGQTTTALASLLLAVAFANLFPAEAYGNYQYILSVAAILTISTLGGMNTALVGAVVRGHDQTLFPALKTKLKWGVIGSVAGLGLAAYYFFSANLVLSIAFLIVALLVPLRDCFQIYLAYWHGKKRFDIFNQNQIAEQALTVGCITATIFFSDNLFLVLLAASLPAIAFRLFSYLRTARQVNRQSSPDLAAITYGKQLSLMGLIGTIAANLDKILIFHFLGAVPVAIYAFAIIPATKVKDIFKVVGELALPRFGERSMEEIRQNMWKKLVKIEILAVGVAALYVLAAPTIFTFLFPAYLGSVVYTQIFITAALFMFPAHILHVALIAKMETKKLYWFRVGVPAVNLLLIAGLLPAFGLWGAVAAYLSSKGLELLTLLVLFYKKENHFNFA